MKAENPNRLRILFVALVFLLVAAVPLQTLATAGPLTFSVASEVPATRGGSVTVPITVSNNPGFTAVGLVVTFDPDVLVLSGIAPHSEDMPLNTQFALSSKPDEQWISLINTGLVDWNDNGAVVSMIFSVKANAPLGVSEISMAFTSGPDGHPTSSGSHIYRDAVCYDGSVNVTDGGGGGPIPPPPAPGPGYPGGGGGSSYVPPSPSPSPSPSPTPTTTPPPAATPDYPEYPQVGGESTGGTDSGADQPGGFIGNLPDASDSAGSGSGASNNGSGFGAVPQTGTTDTTVIAAALGASFSVTAALWGCILHTKRKKSD